LLCLVNFLLNFDTLEGMACAIRTNLHHASIGSFKILITTLFIHTCLINVSAQPYYIAAGVWMIGYDPGDNLCSTCNSYFYGQMDNPVNSWNGCSFDPAGNFFVLSGTNPPPTSLSNNIFQIILPNEQATLIFDGPDEISMGGFVAVGNGIFYSIPAVFENNDTLYRWDVNAGTVTAIGSLGFQPCSEMWMAEGDMYFISFEAGVDNERKIIRVDPIVPSNSEVVCSFPSSYGIFGMTATPISGLFIGTEIWINDIDLYTINIYDCSLTHICHPHFAVSGAVYVQSSPYEHDLDLTSENHIDLDCNDSSGATGSDFNSSDVDCQSGGALIADDDIKLLYTSIISSMTISVEGFVPDAPYELLDIMGSVPGINVAGAGTSMITLINIGTAKASDFKLALQSIVYKNVAPYPTAGLRTIEVQFTTSSGALSNIATAFIQVNELPKITVDLGPDQEICEGQTFTYDAGNPGGGATYQWSNGETTQTITVNTAGEYIVYVSNNTHCPNQDTVSLDVLPIIQISLNGDTSVCDNENATIFIETNAEFPIDIEIFAEPGFPFNFADVTGNYSFTDIPTEQTYYLITEIIPSLPACIDIIDPEHFIDVHPASTQQVVESICLGDSIWLGSSWETAAGTYTNTLNSIYGCDSVVSTTLNILPTETIYLSSWTCDSSLAGVFYYQLNNANGCDTLVQTTVTLLNSDTTIIFQTTCVSSQVGVFQDHFTNQLGCDSLVITSINFVVAHDTTFHFQSSCDSSQVGVFQLVLQGNDNCDSIVIIDIDFGMPDTNFVQATSCDSASLGVFIDHLISSGGCDSTVITTVSYSESDSTFIQSASCNPAETGVFAENHINRFGCDSIVTTTVSLLQSNETFIQVTTCDPANAGVFITSFTNQFGCDSIVNTTVELLPSDETYLSSTTCRSSEAGVFITAHQNQFGCDSTVILIVTLIDSDTTVLANKTCDPAEVGENHTIYTGQDGCDSLVIEQTTLYPPTELNLETSNYNGYSISCFGESDGSIQANANGTTPFTYMWSTGNTEVSIAGISAGSYALTVTDGNGCITSSEVMLFEPDPFSINFEISHPDCFDSDNGIITINQTGGIAPVRYSIDEVNFQSSPIFENLTGGTYTVTALDANDCVVKEIIWINVPLMVSVELGDDMQLFPGDTVVISAIVNVPFDSLASLEWNGLINPDCPGCLTQTVAPVITTSYSVSVSTHDGCSDEDALTLFVENGKDVYVPNIFSPNEDGVNDEFIVSTGNGVEKITSFIIYDRWGNVLYEKANALPGEIKWDGTFHHQMINPGVFAYRLIVEYGGGHQDVLYGDLTLVR
jgi:gliding motility-associated-like protein